MKKLLIISGAAFLMLVALSYASDPGIVPAPFQVRLVATDLIQPKGIESTPHGTGMGVAGHDLYIAEAGTNRFLQIAPETGEIMMSADTPLEFPVGVRAGMDREGRHFYIGGALAGGIVCADTDGVCTPFSLEDRQIAGMDRGHGPFGNDLYAGEWVEGNIWRIDEFGNATLFATLPYAQTRYMKFSQGGDFGTYLYVTDFLAGDIYRIDPTGEATIFANIGSPCLEGLDFGKGGAFGRDLYTGDLCTGEIFRVAPDGTVETWATGFIGVADIKFVPGPRGGATMFFVDGHDSVFEVTVGKNVTPPIHRDVKLNHAQ